MTLYSLFKRQKGDKHYFYVQFKNDDTGRYGTAKSVESLAKKLGDKPQHITKRPLAESVVKRAIEKGLDGNERTEDPLFIDYIANFWDFDNSFYVKKENKKKANSINRDYAYNMAGCAKNHIAPYLPRGLKSSQVKKSHIEKIQTTIIEENSVNVWLSALKCLRAPIKELMRKGILLRDPLFDLEKYSVDRVSSVGALTEAETEKLIRQMYKDVEEGFSITIKQRGPQGTIISKDAIFHLDRRIFLAVCLSAATGMRKGEVLALHSSDIKLLSSNDNAQNQALIIVRYSFAIHQGMKSPKSKKERTVFVDRWLAEALLSLAKENPHKNDLVFFSDTSDDKPIFPTVINKWFNKELDRIGIDEKQRLERHLVFHSLRHYANSEMRTRVGDEKTQEIMGHTSTTMTNLYDTADKTERILGIGQAVGSLIINPEAIKES